jgi:hypothetical protein
MLIRSPQSDDIHVNVLDTNKNNKAGTSTVLSLVFPGSCVWSCEESLVNDATSDLLGFPRLIYRTLDCFWSLFYLFPLSVADP